MTNTAEKFSGHELYYFRSCPFCIKLILAMQFMGIKLPMNNIKDNPDHKAELVKGGGKKQVPCLRIEGENGEVEWMYESSDIIRYLKSQL